MSDINQLKKELQAIIADTDTPAATRAAQITDDVAGRYGDLAGSDSNFDQISDMAGKIVASDATEGENGVMWGEVVRLVHNMLDA
jgi:hypothetical protein